ncbi:MAG TPA: TetR/AcrR family transcriptional regulator [Ktedonobacterales bacterium]|nr:TetR/AcrR family transcriptional regulator [Ktedonobacterales bacterium]
MTTPAPNRRELQAQERRNQLIETALRLFAEKGMENTTIKDIAEAAGVAQGLLYHYYRSKDDLLWAIVGKYNPAMEMGQIFSAASDRPARDVLREAATRAYLLLSERGGALRVMAREALVRQDIQQAFRLAQAVAFGVLARFFDARIATGELRPHNPDVSARMLIGSVLALYTTGVPAESFLEEMVDNLLDGIAAPAPQ